MLSFLLGNKYLAIAKWIAIAGAVWYIFHTWDKAQNYDTVHAQLLAEVNCDPLTACHLRALKAAEAGAKAVTDAIAEVKAQEDRAAQDREKQAKADKEASDKAINEANHGRDLWEQKYRLQLAKDKSCADWSVEKVACQLP